MKRRCIVCKKKLPDNYRKKRCKACESKRGRDNLCDSYVLEKITRNYNISKEKVPDKLLQAYKMQLLTKRLLRKRKNDSYNTTPNFDRELAKIKNKLKFIINVLK